MEQKGWNIFVTEMVMERKPKTFPGRRIKNSHVDSSILRKIPLLLIVLFCPCVDGGTTYANDLLPDIGAVGDNLTDEYSQRAGYYGDSSALNWVDLLAQLRGPAGTLPELDLGSYEVNANVWGAPRYGGYEHNFALWGANTAVLKSQGQYTGVKALISTGHVQYVAVFVGANDFEPMSSYGMYEAIYKQVTPFRGCDGRTYYSAQDYADAVLDRYKVALDTVIDAGGQPVLATIADFGMAPRFANAPGYSDPNKRQNVTDVVIAVNDSLKALAAEMGLPIVDMFGLIRLFYLEAEPSVVGGVSVVKDVAPSPDGRYAILPDGIHPGTVWQGLLANAFLEACNRSYGTSLTPLSDHEILAAAGVAPASPDETFFDIKPYVIVPKCPDGSGTADDPYQIATAANLITLCETPKGYGKHFILIADIDLDPKLPGRRIFEKAVIAPDADPSYPWSEFQGRPFTGIFDGNGHTISNLTITGASYLGLFGCLGPGGEILNLGLEAVDVNGIHDHVGGLVGRNKNGWISNSYSTGEISGNEDVGGLVGQNWGSITLSHSFCTVRGRADVGGLAGENREGIVTQCYSAGVVHGNHEVGGLMGGNYGHIGASYSTSTVSGDGRVGGLVGQNGFDVMGERYEGTISDCYSLGVVSGSSYIGGLVGYGNKGDVDTSYSIGAVIGNTFVGGLVGFEWPPGLTGCFWDVETSGQNASAGPGSTAKTTAEMQTATTFLDAGWDFLGETTNGPEDFWWILDGQDYPRLWWEVVPPAISAVLFELTDVEDPVSVGESATYVIKVKNQGSVAVTNIRITCILDGYYVRYVSSAGATAGVVEGQIVKFLPLSILAPQAEAEWRVDVKVVRAGDARFKAVLNADYIAVAVSDTEPTHLYEW